MKMKIIHKNITTHVLNLQKSQGCSNNNKCKTNDKKLI